MTLYHFTFVFPLFTNNPSIFSQRLYLQKVCECILKSLGIQIATYSNNSAFGKRTQLP